MIFSSIYFTFLFLPIVLLLYYVIRGRTRNIVLLLASLVFYAYGEPVFVFVLMGSVIVNYLLALGIAGGQKEEKSSAESKAENEIQKSPESKKQRGSRAKILLVAAVILNIGLLFVYKYLYFGITLLNLIPAVSLPGKEIALPIGISFFTFQALSYVIDVYRGEQPQKNPLNLGLYICFFPQLIAGPIVRYHDISAQLCAQERFSAKPSYLISADFADGVERFLIGFSKKVLLANQLAVIADAVFDAEDFATVSPGMAWLGSLCFTLQIYYDFSGYSDMAIGLGKMFGFTFLENFNYPYIASSITDFWRRWHMSLSGWFRDYVYIPLGGGRVKTGRRIWNLFVVWLLTGLWHGANLTFVAWGLLYFVFLVLEKYLIKPERFKNTMAKTLYRLFTLAVVNFLWVLFRAKDLTAGIAYIARMFGAGAPAAKGKEAAAQAAISAPAGWYGMMLRQYGIFLVVAIIFAVPVQRLFLNNKKEAEKPEGGCGIRKCISAILLLFAFLWSVSYLILGAHNPFLYFNF
ncbi:MAG: MBOAT family protein [Lachnospiraceae bacterium]|nr:MBOAT family protein [Lachnospiraceae bacterium]